MAFVLPLYRVKGNDSEFRKMTHAEVEAVRQRCVYLYGGNPSVRLAVSGSGTLFFPSAPAGITTVSDPSVVGGLRDSRLQASEMVSSDEELQDTEDASTLRFDYNVARQEKDTVSAPVDTLQRKYPLYWTGTQMRAMSQTDMFDTFISAAVDRLVDGTDADGTFKVVQFDEGNSLTHSNHTLIGSATDFIFKDTVADTGSYTETGANSLATGDEGEVRDQPTTFKLFHLFQANQGAKYGTPTVQHPVKVNSNSEVQTFTASDFDTVLLELMRYYTAEVSGSKITYTLDLVGSGSGQQKGTAIVNSQFDTSLRVTTQVGTTGEASTTYRAQEFPSGTRQTITSHTIRIGRT